MTLNGESIWNYSYQRQKEEQKKKRIKKLHEKLDILSRVNGGLMLVALKGDNEQIDCVKELYAMSIVFDFSYTKKMERRLENLIFRIYKVEIEKVK